MHYLKNTISFTRFKVPGNFSINIEKMEDGIGKNQFRDFSQLHETAEGSVGWVSPDNCLHKLELGPAMTAPFVRLSIRIDRKRVPRAILNANLDIEFKAAMKVSAKRKLSAQEKATIRHDVEKMLLKDVSPTSSVYNALWNYERNIVYLMSTSRKVQDVFRKIFQDTFDREIAPMDPWYWPETSKEDDALGREFLTWLWYHGSSGNSWTINLPYGKVQYGMDDLLEMESKKEVECKQKLTGPVPTNTAEAHASLIEGKQIKKARFYICYKAREWPVTIDADTFTFSTLKLKKATSKHTEERFDELTEDLGEIVNLFDDIYSFFLAIRLSKRWHEQELHAMKLWSKQK
jgi:hypothetical protein